MISEIETSSTFSGVVKKVFDDIIANSQFVNSESPLEKENSSYL